jgi:hypothetical protein
LLALDDVLGDETEDRQEEHDHGQLGGQDQAESGPGREPCPQARPFLCTDVGVGVCRR